jgi:hypothetical protein
MGERKRRTAALLRSQRDAFVKKFGQVPGPNDPLIFYPDADSPVALSKEKLRAQMMDVMKAAGSPPHLVFAYAKTGFMPTDEAYNKMAPADRAAYDAAVEEYFETVEAQKEGGSN